MPVAANASRTPLSIPSRRASASAVTRGARGPYSRWSRPTSESRQRTTRHRSSAAAPPDADDPRPRPPWEASESVWAWNHGRRAPSLHVPVTTSERPACPSLSPSEALGMTTVRSPQPSARSNGADPLRGVTTKRPSSDAREPTTGSRQLVPGRADAAASTPISATQARRRPCVGLRDARLGDARKRSARSGAVQSGAPMSPQPAPAAKAKANRVTGAACNYRPPTPRQQIRCVPPVS